MQEGYLRKAQEYLDRALPLLHQRGYVEINDDNFRFTRKFLDGYRRALILTKTKDNALKLLFKGYPQDEQEGMFYVTSVLIENTERQLGRKLV